MLERSLTLVIGRHSCFCQDYETEQPESKLCTGSLILNFKEKSTMPDPNKGSLEMRTTGGQGRWHTLGIDLAPWRSMFICKLIFGIVLSSMYSIFPFPLSEAKLIGNFSINRHTRRTVHCASHFWLIFVFCYTLVPGTEWDDERGRRRKPSYGEKRKQWKPVLISCIFFRFATHRVRHQAMLYNEIENN